MTAVVVRLAFRHWAATLGTSPGRLIATLTTGTVALAATAHATVERLAVPSTGPETVLLGLSVAVFAGAGAFAVFASHASVLPPGLGFLRTLPVPPAALRRAASAPVAILGSAVLAAVSAPLVAFTATLAGYGRPHALLGLVLLVSAGTALGQLTWTATRRSLPGPALASLRLTAAYLAWLVLVGASLAAPAPALRLAGWPGGAAVLAPLGWPLAWWALVEPSDLAVVSAVAVVVVLWAVVVRTRTPLPTTARSGRPVRSAAIGDHDPLLVTALVTAVRLRRNPRTLEALLVSAGLALATVLAAAWVTRAGPARLSPTAVALLGSQVATGFAVLVRGLSGRAVSAEAALGIGAAHHVGGAWTAVLAMATVVSLPSLVPLALLTAPSAVAVWLAGLVLHAAVAIGVSTALVPTVGNGGAEATALLTYVAVDTVAVRLLGLASAGVVLVALLTAVAVEHRRRS